MKRSFGDRLAEARGTRKRSEMANVFGVSVSTYGNWERGDKEPGIETIGNICRHFGISADWLLGLSCAAPSGSGGVHAATPDAPSGGAGESEAHWRSLALSQQATIASLTEQLAAASHPDAAPVVAGGRTATKTA